MSNYFASLSLRGATQKKVGQAIRGGLPGTLCYVSPADNGWVTICPADSETNPDCLAEIAKLLCPACKSAAVGLAVHGETMLTYWLFDRSGALRQVFNLSTDGPKFDHRAIARLAGSTSIAVAMAMRSHDPAGALAELLGIVFAGLSYSDLLEEDDTDGTEGGFIHVQPEEDDADGAEDGFGQPEEDDTDETEDGFGHVQPEEDDADGTEDVEPEEGDTDGDEDGFIHVDSATASHPLRLYRAEDDTENADPDAGPGSGVAVDSGSNAFLFPRCLYGDDHSVRSAWKKITRKAWADGNWDRALAGVELYSVRELPGTIFTSQRRYQSKELAWRMFWIAEILKDMATSAPSAQVDTMERFDQLMVAGFQWFWFSLGLLDSTSGSFYLDCWQRRRPLRRVKIDLLRGFVGWLSELVTLSNRYESSAWANNIIALAFAGQFEKWDRGDLIRAMLDAGIIEESAGRYRLLGR